MLDLPKPVKLADVAAALVAVDERVSALEAVAASNRARLDRIDATAQGAAAAAGGTRAAVDRDRWLRTLRRR